ncbi:MAG: hypothetical protein JNL98_34900 [Bryobacterales bacterium]|nr:hypothetical protein [Bryobacterales bacterium]
MKLILSVFLLTSFAQGQTEKARPCRPLGEANNSELFARLREVDALRNAERDEMTLIRELSTNAHRRAAVSAYALGHLPKTEQSVLALRLASRKARLHVAYFASSALCQLGDLEWMRGAEDRIREPARDAAAIEMASILALNGSYAGWPRILDLLRQAERPDDPFAMAALGALHYFVRARDGDDPVTELWKDRNRYPAVRVAIEKEIRRLKPELAQSE